MQTQQDVKKIIKELCRRAASLFPQDKIEAILFGSYARGDAESGSDIDVLILVGASRQDNINAKLEGRRAGRRFFAGVWNRSISYRGKSGLFHQKYECIAFLPQHCP